MARRPVASIRQCIKVGRNPQRPPPFSPTCGRHDPGSFTILHCVRLRRGEDEHLFPSFFIVFALAEMEDEYLFSSFFIVFALAEVEDEYLFSSFFMVFPFAADECH